MQVQIKRGCNQDDIQVVNKECKGIRTLAKTYNGSNTPSYYYNNNNNFIKHNNNHIF